MTRKNRAIKELVALVTHALTELALQAKSLLAMAMASASQERITATQMIAQNHHAVLA